MTVPTGIYDVAIKGKPDGIEVKTDKIVVSRGKDVLVQIVRVTKGPDVTARPHAEEKAGEIRRIAWEGGGTVLSTAMSADGRYYLAAGTPDKVRVWELQTGKQLHEFTGCIAYFTPDSKQIVAGNWINTQFRLYDVATGNEIRTFGSEGQLWNFRISPDGKYVASFTGSNTIHIWELSTGKELHKLTSKTDKFMGVFSSERKCFVYSLDDKPYRVLDLETGKDVRAFESIRDKKRLYRFLPGDREVMGYCDTTLQFYEVATGKLVRELDLGTSADFIPESLSTDGQRFLSVYPDGTFRLWDMATGKVLYRWAMIDGKNSRPPFMSTDGRYAVAASDDGSVYLWRLPMWQGRTDQ